MGNLTRYTLSWTVLLVTVCVLSYPIRSSVTELITRDGLSGVLFAAIAALALPVGYALNLVPLLLSRYHKRHGLYGAAVADAGKEPRYVTDEMRKQCDLLEDKLGMLTSEVTVVKEAREARADKWTHLIIHYNLMCSLTLAVALSVGIALRTGSWILGLPSTWRAWGGSSLTYIVYGGVAVLFALLAMTAAQTRWQIVRVYQIERKRMQEVFENKEPGDGTARMYVQHSIHVAS